MNCFSYSHGLKQVNANLFLYLLFDFRCFGWNVCRLYTFAHTFNGLFFFLFFYFPTIFANVYLFDRLNVFRGLSQETKRNEKLKKIKYIKLCKH